MIFTAACEYALYEMKIKNACIREMIRWSIKCKKHIFILIYKESKLYDHFTTLPCKAKKQKVLYEVLEVKLSKFAFFSFSYRRL